jgi:hypothetical protein
MRHLLTACFLTAAIAGGVPPASGQDRPRVMVSVNGGYQSTTTEFGDSFTFTLHQETGTSRLTYPIEAGAVFDGGLGVRLWRGLGVGVAASRFVVDGSVQASSSIPHPFFFQRLREVSGEADGMRREETAAHVQAQYELPPFGNLRVMVMGGPSVFDIKQTVVTNVRFTEEFPYDTATFAGVDSRRVSGTANGFNAGVDVRWMFSKNIGVGALVRFSHAEIPLDAGSNRTIRVDAGGTHVGAGIRLAF